MKSIIVLATIVAVGVCVGGTLYCEYCDEVVQLGAWTRKAEPEEGTHTCSGAGELTCYAWASSDGRCPDCKGAFASEEGGDLVGLSVTVGQSDTGTVGPLPHGVGTASWTLSSNSGDANN